MLELPEATPTAMPPLLRCAVIAIALLALPRAAAGQTVPAAPTVARPAPPRTLVEARVLLAQPAALPTGMAVGFDAAFTRGWRRWLAWGVRASWATATEYANMGYAVRDDDIRLRAIGVVHRQIGRVTLALRLGLGATVVRERRTLSNDALAADLFARTAWALLPAFELEPAVVMRIAGAWGLSLSGGPSVHIVNGEPNWGWTSAMGVTWQR